MQTSIRRFSLSLALSHVGIMHENGQSRLSTRMSLIVGEQSSLMGEINDCQCNELLVLYSGENYACSGTLLK